MKSLANPSKARQLMVKEINRLTTERTKLGMKYNAAANALALLDGGFLTVEEYVEYMKLYDKYNQEINEKRIDFNDILQTLKTDYGLDLMINV